MLDYNFAAISVFMWIWIYIFVNIFPVTSHSEHRCVNIFSWVKMSTYKFRFCSTSSHICFTSSCILQHIYLHKKMIELNKDKNVYHRALCSKDANTTLSVVFLVVFLGGDCWTQTYTLATDTSTLRSSLTTSWKSSKKSVSWQGNSCGYLIVSIICCHSHCFRLNNTFKSHLFCSVQYVFFLYDLAFGIAEIFVGQSLNFEWEFKGLIISLYVIPHTFMLRFIGMERKCFIITILVSSGKHIAHIYGRKVNSLQSEMFNALITRPIRTAS